VSAPPTGVVIGIATLFGLLIGSFLNVVVYRLPRGESVAHPPSHCPRCATPLAPSENVPLVSWLVLRGRCRHCHEPISARYPLLEALTALAFGCSAGVAGPGALLVPLLLLSAGVIAASAIDLDGFTLPWAVVGAFVAAAALFGLIAAVSGAPGRLAWAAGFGAAAAIGWWRTSSGPWPGAVTVALLAWSAGWAGWWGGVAVTLLVPAGVCYRARVSFPHRPADGRRFPLWLVLPAGFAIMLVAVASR
jgi:leader peptidase (prepilin peptidase)/N-methyltransferase